MVPTAAEAAPAYPQGPPSSRGFFQPLSIETKEHNEPGGAANQWDAGAVSLVSLGPSRSLQKGELLAGAAAHRRESQRSVKCSWEAPDSAEADLHFTRELVAFSLRFPSPTPLIPHFPSHSATGCLKHEVGQKSSEQ